jgi:2-iminoacetate synthase ThiH
MKIRQTFAGSSAHVSETSKDFLHLAQHASHFQNRFHPFVGEIPVSVRKKKTHQSSGRMGMGQNPVALLFLISV